MCMILAQTFYKVGNDNNNNLSDGEIEADKDKDSTQTQTINNTPERIKNRGNRIYIKDKLKDHPIWSDEHFWDQALFQCISDALTKSGILQSLQADEHSKKI